MFRRRGAGSARPSLLRSAARGAVVAGTAATVAGSVAQRRAAREGQGQDVVVQPDGPAPAPEIDTDHLIAQLRQLGELRDSGVLTEQEFNTQKTRLLN
ncbi:putative oligomerization/nucleic acid binding protein [Antricoccus suffuscus]|uniref:Putative oligomerization/nucleic acid binding protein n=1 Tax=Antricoccus suffuscus TaxID=1629062 RepID=A0A2T1A654_9ACTN|nr:putative oligomerization/nucleic acid binding protein [Antricoccus suffuscus]